MAYFFVEQDVCKIDPLESVQISYKNLKKIAIKHQISMERIINTAIIGFGLSGRVFHAPFLHTHPGFKLTKVVERHGQYMPKNFIPRLRLSGIIKSC